MGPKKVMTSAELKRRRRRDSPRLRAVKQKIDGGGEEETLSRGAIWDGGEEGKNGEGRGVAAPTSLLIN